jgi:hypothetical protein
MTAADYTRITRHLLLEIVRVHALLFAPSHVIDAELGVRAFSYVIAQLGSPVSFLRCLGLETINSSSLITLNV